MNTIIRVGSAMIVGLILFGCNRATAQSKTETIHISTRIYCDHCQKCETCRSLIEESVYRLKGVKRVDIDVASMSIRVAYNADRTNPDQIRNSIAAVGYDADSLSADPDAYSRLDACCKK